ncbi:hypothetical protein TNCV_4347501 [Trichonephila clavipes]|nr:hypothetical protein TNCV_4347501 [Trichonephila clavipes]
MKVVKMSKDNKWAVLDKNLSWVLGAPRNSALAYFRLLIGHDYLRSYLYITGIAFSPDCSLCDSGQPMTVEHLVLCPALINLNSIVENIGEHLP